MAITQMAKVMIVAHRSQASDLLEVLQAQGICQILNADEAVVSKDFPDLAPAAERPKDIEQMLNRLSRSLKFLTPYSEPNKGLAAALAPRTVIDENSYDQVVSDNRITNTIERAEQTEAAVEKLKAKCETLEADLEMLAPWVALRTPVEELGRLHKTTCLTGLIPVTQFDKVADQLAELGAALQQIAASGNKHACLIVCLNDSVPDVQKALRSAEFGPVAFESMTGTVADLINERRKKLDKTKSKLQQHYDEAASLSRDLLKLQVLHDHHSNLLAREQTRGAAPATEQTVILEGWVKEKDFGRLEKTVSRFKASSLTRIDPAEDEQIPVEIENKNYIRPFEVITRLYGMPRHFEVDPTVFLAPFFALFFGLCLTDAGYGLVIFAISIYFVIKMQGDKKLIWMLTICSVATVIAGALMGGWFGDAVQKFMPLLEPLRQRMMWFDPMQYPLRFFILSLVLGYIQIMAGLLIAFLHDLKRKLYIAALCDRLSWLIMLNCVVAFAFAKAGKLPGKLSSAFGFIALFSAAIIFLFSHREGGWGARLGMGFYNLFSAIFYIGDVLSYLRLMALGLVTAGLAMAVNQIAELAYELPFIGLVAAALVIVGGHLFNLGINALGAFVHTLRLQYAEFFPKFFVGGGLSFKPLEKTYKHIYVKKT
ncbi:MAG: V-type ATP synthase subunit I [Planctomycetota bacterium]|jgi:V/A-type H+-transporting ATPase subunit I